VSFVEIPEPMLARSVDRWELKEHRVAEPKFDGFRALLAHHEDGTVTIRSRRGTDMTSAFPEIAGPLAALPEPVLLDSELVVWENGRLAFERLSPRLNRTAAATARLAEAAPASAVVFDLLHWAGVGLRGLPYTERRAHLEDLFVAGTLASPFYLCPSTSEPAVAEGWLRDWASAGIEGLIVKDGRASYKPGMRSWSKWRLRDTEEAIVAAVTGRPARPRVVLLARHDSTGRLRYIGRSTPLPESLRGALGALLTPATSGHPWEGRRFAAAWGSKETLTVELVRPDVVVEVSADTARDQAGRFRHPVRAIRTRPDLGPSDVPEHDG
jgi:ATP-dependent DNA ligase